MEEKDWIKEFRQFKYEEIFIKEYDEFIKKKDVMFNKKYLKKKDIKNIKSGNGKLFEIYNELLALK